MNSPRPSVLLITGSLGPGGTELAVISLARELHRRGRFLPAIAVLTEGGRWGEDLRSEGIEVEELGLTGPIRNWTSVRRLMRLRRIVREKRISVVHTFLFEADFYGMIAARLGRPGVVITTRRAIKANRPHHLRGYRCTNFLVDRVVANSTAVREFTIEREKLQPEKVLSISNGVDLDRFSGGRRERFRMALGIGPEELLVAAVGTIKSVKGQDLLLEAMEPLLAADRPLRLLLAGEVTRGFGEDLRKRAAAFGEKVLMPGVVREVPDLLAALDLFVLPSRSEGMSNALLEAMAAGRPIVATRVGGNAENLDEGRAGALVSSGDVLALRSELERLLGDVPGRSVLAGAAARRARSEYSLGRMLERTETLYEELLTR